MLLDRESDAYASALSRLDEITYLGTAATKCILFELSRREANASSDITKPTKGNLLDHYLYSRRTKVTKKLPDLPVPAQFRQVFRDWAAGRVDFVEFVDAEPDGEGGATDR
jgi:hypothetical protein